MREKESYKEVYTPSLHKQHTMHTLQCV